MATTKIKIADKDTLDAIQSLLTNGTYGLSALKSAIAVGGGGSGIQAYSSIVTKYCTYDWKVLSTKYPSTTTTPYGATVSIDETTTVWTPVWSDVTISGSGMVLLSSYSAELNIDGLGFFTPPYNGSAYQGSQSGLMFPFTKSLIFRSRYGTSNYTYTEKGNTTANPGGKPSAGKGGYATFFII